MITRECTVCRQPIRYKPSASVKVRRPTCSLKCLGADRSKSYLGEMNPNKRYRFDERYFQDINSEEKAYFLGWIASDGCLRKDKFVIKIHKKDKLLLSNLRDLICPDLPLKFSGNFTVLSVCSVQMVNDIGAHLGVKPGTKKAFTVRYPEMPASFDRHFIRGFFDGDGSVRSPIVSVRSNGNKPVSTYPVCSIASGSQSMVLSIKEKSSVRPHLYRQTNKKTGNDEYRLEWNGNNALDFMSWLYEPSQIFLHRKHDMFRDWSMWVPGLSGASNYGKSGHFRWVKTDPAAVPPSKVRASDSGYDLTLIKKVRDLGPGVALYDTCVKVQPAYGWYFLVAARSSLSKTSFALANSVGIIDRSYTGSIMVALRSFDGSEPSLPFRAAQMIPMPIVHMSPQWADELSDTARGTGGFGSSGA